MNTILRLSALVIIILFLASFKTAKGQSVDYDPEYYAANYFDMSNLEIAFSEIYPGGDIRMGIEVVDEALFASIDEAHSFMQPDDRLVVATYNGVSKAYPIRLLSHHEVINDDFGGEKVAVTYNALTNSANVFKSEKLGMSAMVFSNNPMVYDAETRSLYTQLDGKSIAGEKSGQRLEMIPSEIVAWQDWSQTATDVAVFSTDNSKEIDYTTPAFDTYASTDELPFPVSYSRKTLAEKEMVVGIEVDGKTKAYPFSIMHYDNGMTEDYFNGMQLKIHYNEATGAVKVTDEEGTMINSTTCYWYAWYSFNTSTSIYGFLPMKLQMASLNDEE